MEVALDSQRLHRSSRALQGGFTEHLHLLSLLPTSFDISLSQIRTPAQLALVQALIIPGGESTTISLLVKQAGLLEPLRQFTKDAREGKNGRTVWGTCAGMILLSAEVVGSKEGYEGLGGVDAKVVRNQWGRQVSIYHPIVLLGLQAVENGPHTFVPQAESFQHALSLPFLSSPAPFNAIFIRAPILHTVLPIPATSPPLEIFARVPLAILPASLPDAEPLGPDADVVMARQGNLVISSFHPELGGDTRVHEWWVTHCAMPN